MVAQHVLSLYLSYAPPLGLMVGLGARLGPDAWFNYTDISISVPDTYEMFPDIFAGDFARSHCGTRAFGWKFASKTAEMAKFPVNFPVGRESQVETGSI
jgi:hypothetical protein